MSELREEIDSLMRYAYKPDTKSGIGERLGSRFGGPAWLLMEENWPECPNCGLPMNLFLQLNLSEIPIEVGETLRQGMIQLFYCVNDEPHCEADCLAFEPFAESMLVRRIYLSDEGSMVAAPHGHFPARHIVGWSLAVDYPHWEEAAEYGVSYSRDQTDGFEKPVEGDKLLGWPAWVQEVSYPRCPECNRHMTYLFQIDSDDNIPHYFGSLGTGHLTYCEVHPEQVAFAWACT